MYWRGQGIEDCDQQGKRVWKSHVVDYTLKNTKQQIIVTTIWMEP